MAVAGIADAMELAADAIGNSHNIFPATAERLWQFVKRTPSDDMHVSIAHDLLKVLVIIRTDRVARRPQLRNVGRLKSELVAKNVPTKSEARCKPDTLL